jgi:hypothetical protein
MLLSALMRSRQSPPWRAEGFRSDGARFDETPACVVMVPRDRKRKDGSYPLLGLLWTPPNPPNRQAGYPFGMPALYGMPQATAAASRRKPQAAPPGWPWPAGGMGQTWPQHMAGMPGAAGAGAGAAFGNANMLDLSALLQNVLEANAAVSAATAVLRQEAGAGQAHAAAGGAAPRDGQAGKPDGARQGPRGTASCRACAAVNGEPSGTSPVRGSGYVWGSRVCSPWDAAGRWSDG